MQAMRMPEYREDFNGAIAAHGRCRISSNGDKEVQLVDYSIGDSQLMGVAANSIPSPLLDLVDILRGISLIDGRMPRRLKGDERPLEQRGARRLLVTFPVREPDFWRDSSASKLLRSLLWHLSGDELVSSFAPIRERSRSFEAQGRLPLQLAGDFGAATLLSGGIDSVFGLINCFDEVQANGVLAISTWSHHRHLELQSRIANVIGYPRPLGWGRRFTHLAVELNAQPNFLFRESSRKLRILGFISGGVLASTGAGLNRLIVAENGPGALNLPSNPVLGGPQLNRAMHPKTLRLFAELFSTATGKPFFIENVGLRFIKRQMIADLKRRGFARLIEQTNSCDRFVYAGQDKHCGTCSSCLLRALALLDVPDSLDRIGTNSLRSLRHSAMSRSLAFMHLSMLGVQLDRILKSSNSIESLWAIDPNIKDVLRVIDEFSLLTMLQAFRGDILELEDRIGEGYAPRIKESPELLSASGGS